MSENIKQTENSAENGNKSKPVLCEVFDFLGMQFNVTQYKWGRKLYGGVWYKINPKGLRMATFWSRNEIKSCQSETVGYEAW